LAAIDKLRLIKRRFLPSTELPELGLWKRKSNNGLWMEFVFQVIVVGNSAPAGVLSGSPKLKREISWARLGRISSDPQVAKIVNRVLRAVGTRYASRVPGKCKKTRALVRNLRRLQRFRGGPRGLFQTLAAFDGPGGDARKVKYLMAEFDYFGSKSARDFLMSLGMITGAIALDVRLQKVLKKVGITVPGDLATSVRSYDEFERRLIAKVCKPLGLTAVQLDKMVYQNYDDIMALG
jgi:thermostable 8-oxoguanine DNA glycosylase